jgi:hypothetical protein
MLGLGYGIGLVIIGILFIIFKHYFLGACAIVFAYVLVYNMNKGMESSSGEYVSTIRSCPKCGSVNCSAFAEQHYVGPKTKKRVDVNLNPLKPFTVYNVKEKTVKESYTYSVGKFICNDCGKIF